MLNNYFTLMKIILFSAGNVLFQKLEQIAADSRHQLFLQLENQTIAAGLGARKNFFFFMKKRTKLPVPHFKRFEQLYGHQLTAIHLFDQERVIDLQFDQGFTLRFFLFQPYSNAVLFRDDQILVESYFSKKKESIPGSALSRKKGMALPNPAFIEHQLNEYALDEAIKLHFPSLNQPDFIRELAFRLNRFAREKDISNIVRTFFEEIQSPYVTLPKTREVPPRYTRLLPYIPLTVDEETEPEVFDNPNYAVQHYLRANENYEEFTSRKEYLFTLLQQEMKYTEHTIQRLKQQLRRSQDRDKLVKTAQLIMWNLNNIPPNVREARLVDYESPELEEVTVRLNPHLSPREYAEELFIQAKKMEEVEVIHERLDIMQKRMNALHDLTERLKRASSNVDLEEVQTRMEKMGMETSRTSTGKGQATRIPWYEYFYKEYTILVGKSSRESDELTTKTARKFHWFFHAQDIRGSHVIVSHPEKKKLEVLPPDIIQTAAIIAAYYSEARNSSLVPVQYTQVRYVRKPRKAPAGLVLLQNYKTIFVEPQAFSTLNLKTRREQI